MKDNKSLKQKLNSKEITIGSWITLSDLSTAEIMSKAGFDWLAVDMEHSAITIHQAQQIIQIIELSGVVPLVRVGENNPDLIKHVMDAGAHGVIVPMVKSKQDAVKAVEAVKYPPEGTRGVGLTRAQGYGLGFEKYRDWVNEESIVIAQIEHIDAVESLDEILGVEGVDGFMVGPYDLSASMGMPGEFYHDSVVRAMSQIMKIAGNHNKVPGFHIIKPDGEEIHRKVEEGYKLLAFSIDILFLGYKCRDEIRKFEKLLGK
jgi:2-keto-3-deoxy-L-rhamnonate aldolase RhmA